MVVGRGWQSLLGYTSTDLVAKRLYDFIHPDDRSDLLSNISSSASVSARVLTRSGGFQGFVWTFETPRGGLSTGIAIPAPKSDDLESASRLYARAPSFNFIYDVQRQQVVQINPEIKQVLGYSQLEIKELDRRVEEFMVHSEDISKLTEMYNRLQTTNDGVAIETEFRARHRDGSWRWLWVRGTVYSRDEAGTPVEILASAQDVSLRREREETYRLLFDANPNPMWVFDSETDRLLAANDAAVVRFGYTRYELLQMTAEGIADRVEAASETEPAIYSFRAKDGEFVRAETYSSRLDFMGRPAKMLLAVEVTEKELVQTELRNAKEILEAIVESAPVGILSVNRNGVVETWNPAAERIFQRPTKEAIGRSLSSLSRRPSVAFNLLQSHIIEGILVTSMPLAIRNREGVRLELEASTRSISGESGDSIGTMAIITDVTARNDARRALQKLNNQLEVRVAERTAELVAANQELEAFCFSVSHDLRAPLRAIDGFSRAVLEDSEDRLSVASVNHLSRVRNASKRMSDLIDALLSLTRLTRVKIERTQINISAIAEVAANDIQTTNPNHQVTWHIQPDLFAFCDSKLIFILFDNLFRNSFKFTRDAENPQVWFGQDETGRFFVGDNGAGFDMAFSNRLFKPFERLHTTAEFAGNGIGLATAHRIVTRHGGTISAEGGVNKGATILFTIGEGPA